MRGRPTSDVRREDETCVLLYFDDATKAVPQALTRRKYFDFVNFYSLQPLTRNRRRPQTVAARMTRRPAAAAATLRRLRTRL